MIQLAHHKKMSVDEISDLCRSATAVIGLCESAAWAIQNGNPDAVRQTVDDMQHGLQVARALLETLQDHLDVSAEGSAI